MEKTLRIKKRKTRDTSTNKVVSASISKHGREVLDNLAKDLNISKSEIIERALLLYKRREDMLIENYNRIMSDVDNSLMIEELKDRRF